MIISQSLLKYGYSSFSLEILEYCTASKAIEREQYYLDTLKPSYNILKTAGSRLGLKHSSETIAKLKALIMSPEHKAKIWTLEHKASHLERLKIHNASKQQQEHLKGLQTSKSNRVEVLDTLTKQLTVYPSISEAALAMGCHKTTISKTFQHQKENGVSRPIKKRFTVKPADDKQDPTWTGPGQVRQGNSKQKMGLLKALSINSVYVYNRDKSVLYYFTNNRQIFLQDFNIHYLTFEKHLEKALYYLGRYLFTNYLVPTSKNRQMTWSEFALKLKDSKSKHKL